MDKITNTIINFRYLTDLERMQQDNQCHHTTMDQKDLLNKTRTSARGTKTLSDKVLLLRYEVSLSLSITRSFFLTKSFSHAISWRQGKRHRRRLVYFPLPSKAEEAEKCLEKKIRNKKPPPTISLEAVQPPSDATDLVTVP